MEENKYALSLPQRLILVNQYKILKCLTDNVTEQQDYDNLITALENGYELHYQDCFEYMGENTNPPIYSQNIKLLKETCSVLVGNRSVSDALNGNVAVFKTFQDSQRAYDKSQEK